MRIYLCTLALLAIGSSFVSCNKEETPNDNTAVEDFTALKVDGIYKEDTESGGGYISGSNEAAVSGDFSDGDVLFILVDDAASTGTYILDAVTDDCTYSRADGEIFSLSNAGSSITFTIDEISASGVIRGMKGTFSGELFNDSGESITITEGEFSDL